MTMCLTRYTILAYAMVELITTLAVHSTLYAESPHVQTLSAIDFNSVMTNPSRGLYIVEFFSSQCGFCVQFAPTWKKLAKSLVPWKPKVNVAAIDCTANYNLCTQQNIRGYPTIQIYGDLTKPLQGEEMHISQNVVDNFRQEVIDYIVNDSKMPWKSILEYSEADKVESMSQYDAIVLVVEYSNSSIGQMLVMDMLPVRESIPVIRLRPSPTSDFAPASDDTAAVYILHKNQIYKVDRGDRRRLARRRKSAMSTWYDSVSSALVGLGLDVSPLNEVNQAMMSDESATPAPCDGQFTFDPKNFVVYMADIESGISYIFQTEIPMQRVIDGRALIFVRRWIRLLRKYLPLRTYMDNSLAAIQELADSKDSVKGEEIREAALVTEVPNRYMAVQYQHCKGSMAYYRGYPCTVWLLFHTLTVRLAQAHERTITVADPLDNPITMYDAFVDFMRFFFTCRQCSYHFTKFADKTRALIDSPMSLVIAIWQGHNRANVRLNGTLTDDPTFPKMEFPMAKLCPSCGSAGNYSLPKVYDFLKRYYSPDMSIELSPSDLVGSQSPWLKLQVQQQAQEKLQKRKLLFLCERTKQCVTIFVTATCVTLFTLALGLLSIYWIRRMNHDRVIQKTL